MLSYDQVKDKPTILQAFTDHTQAEFEELLAAFTIAWQQLIEEEQAQRERKRKPGGGRKPKLETMADRLFFILFYLKTYPLQEVLAFLFSVSPGQANEWVLRYAKVLQRALDNLGHLTERDGERLGEALHEQEPLSFTQDGSERRRQRPKDTDKQKQYYRVKRSATRSRIIWSFNLTAVVFGI